MTRHASTRAQIRAAGNVLAGSVMVLLPVAILAFQDWRAVVALAAGVAGGAVLVWRAATIRVDEVEDGLVVRNVLTTRRVRWADVTEFRERHSILVSARSKNAVCPELVVGGEPVTLLGMPVAERFRGMEEHRYQQSAVVERWAREHAT